MAGYIVLHKGLSLPIAALFRSLRSMPHIGASDHFGGSPRVDELIE